MSDAQTRVQALLDDLVDSGTERGVQVAIYCGEELVVDAWAGVADPATGRLVDGDTLFTVFSTTKGIVATLIHRLVAAGVLDYDTPIARYWPEFGANGKHGITIRQVLTHSAGIPQMPDGAGVTEACDWDGMCKVVAGLTPLWPAGQFTGYHALTIGWILGGVAERATARPLADLMRDEICAPLNITSLCLGVDDAAAGRVATLESGPPTVPDPEPPASEYPFADFTRSELDVLATPLPFQPLEVVFSRPEVRRAIVPAVGGIMNARAIARIYAALACGSIDGIELLTRDHVDRIRAEQTAAVDLVQGVHIRKGLGYFLNGPRMTLPGAPTAFGHPGYGGSLGFAEPEHRFAFGFTKNRMVGGSDAATDSSCRIVREARAALRLP